MLLKKNFRASEKIFYFPYGQAGNFEISHALLNALYVVLWLK